MSRGLNILIVGGAGYIGSHMVKFLSKSNVNVKILDNFSTGHRDSVQGVSLAEGCISDSQF